MYTKHSSPRAERSGDSEWAVAVLVYGRHESRYYALRHAFATRLEVEKGTMGQALDRLTTGMSYGGS